MTGVQTCALPIYAARTLITFGFGPLGLHRISAAAGPDNTASIAVIKRLGMAAEGRIRDHVYTNNAWRDSLLYSLLASEWAPEHQAVAGAASQPRLAEPAWRTGRPSRLRSAEKSAFPKKLNCESHLCTDRQRNTHLPRPQQAPAVGLRGP